MLTETQQIILTCLLGPEDPKAFEREGSRLRSTKRAGRPEATLRKQEDLAYRERLFSAGLKGCPKCGEEKPLSAFSLSRGSRDGYSGYCKSCAHVSYVEKGPEKHRAQSNKAARKARSTPEGREKDRQNSRKFRKDFPEKATESNRKCNLNRRRRDPAYRVLLALRSRLHGALRRQGVEKTTSTFDLLGCPFVWLQVHLESLFRPGMTWKNQGKVWHIDHIKPCASFNLLDPEQQKSCFHWTNLQPLFAAENLSKGDKYVG